MDSFCNYANTEISRSINLLYYMVFTNGSSCFDSVYLTYFLLSLTIEHVTKEHVLSFIISFSIFIFLGLFTLYLKWLLFKEKNLVFSVFGHSSHRMFFGS